MNKTVMLIASLYGSTVLHHLAGELVPTFGAQHNSNVTDESLATQNQSNRS